MFDRVAVDIVVDCADKDGPDGAHDYQHRKYSQGKEDDSCERVNGQPSRKEGMTRTIMARNWISPKLKVAARLSPHFSFIREADRLKAAMGPKFS